MRGDWDKLRKVNLEAGADWGKKAAFGCLGFGFLGFSPTVFPNVTLPSVQPDSQVTYEHLEQLLGDCVV